MYLVAIIQIIIIAIAIFAILSIFHRTRSAQIFYGMLLITLLPILISYFLSDLKVLSFILRQLPLYATITLIITFQPEIRKLLTIIGSSISSASSRWKFHTKVNDIIEALEILSRNKTGALIAIELNTSLGDYTFSKDTVILNADLTSKLLLSIFFKNAPLHDGGVIISKNKIVASRCIFPNSSAHLERGLRHRAGLGLSEVSDAIILIVSEETGNVSLARDGHIMIVRDFAWLTTHLTKILALQSKQRNAKNKSKIFKLNIFETIIDTIKSKGLLATAALAISVILYFGIDMRFIDKSQDFIEHEVPVKVDTHGNDFSFEPDKIKINIRGDQQFLNTDNLACSIILNTNDIEKIKHGMPVSYSLSTKNISGAYGYKIKLPTTNIVISSREKLDVISDKFSIKPPMTTGKAYRSIAKVDLHSPTITLTGKRDDIAKLREEKFVITLPDIDVDGRTKSFQGSIPVPEISAYPYVVPEETSIKYTVSITEDRNERTITAPIRLSLPNNITTPIPYTLTPSSVDITITGWRDDVNSIDSNKVYINALVPDNFDPLLPTHFPLEVTLPPMLSVDKPILSIDEVEYLPNTTTTNTPPSQLQR